MKTLVTFFSVEYGNTRKIANALAKELNADIFEIIPANPYTKADINWRNPLSRCNREFFGKKEVPVDIKVENMNEYDEIYVGFPIWYGCAPLVVNSFLKSYNLEGKKIYIFATSGGSGIGKTAQKLEPYVKGATIVDARMVQTEKDAEDYAKN